MPSHHWNNLLLAYLSRSPLSCLPHRSSFLIILTKSFFVSVYDCTLSTLLLVVKISTSIHPATHPFITPSVSISSTTYNITPSLVDDPRHNLEKWTENVETHARSMCAMHDVTGALTLLMTDAKWQQMPVNLTRGLSQSPNLRHAPGSRQQCHVGCH